MVRCCRTPPAPSAGVVEARSPPSQDARDDIANILLSMRAPEPEAGDAGAARAAPVPNRGDEADSLFRRVTGGERQLSPRCIAKANDDLATVVTQGTEDKGARRRRASPKKAPAALATMRLATASLMIIEVAARSGRCEQDFSAHCQHDAQPGARGRARRR